MSRSRGNRETMEDPPFRCMVRSAPFAEAWTHTNEDYKLKEFGWRCNTEESVYSLDTLLGNWEEERRDIEELKKPECLPSQHGHYFESTYHTSYNRCPVKTVPDTLRNLTGRHPHGHPAHQPELDGEEVKAVYNSWETTERLDYLPPGLRTRPVRVAPSVRQDVQCLSLHRQD